jgi:hypothetical protein
MITLLTTIRIMNIIAFCDVASFIFAEVDSKYKGEHWFHHHCDCSVGFFN